MFYHWQLVNNFVTNFVVWHLHLYYRRCPNGFPNSPQWSYRWSLKETTGQTCPRMCPGSQDCQSSSDTMDRCIPKILDGNHIKILFNHISMEMYLDCSIAPHPSASQLLEWLPQSWHPPCSVVVAGHLGPEAVVCAQVPVVRVQFTAPAHDV